MAVHVKSRQGEVFGSREEAGHALAEELNKFIDNEALILGIPRGGVVTAAAVAEDLDCELDIVIVRKLGAPNNPELAIGSIMEGSDEPYLNTGIVRTFGVSQSYIEQEVEKQRIEAARRAEAYRKGKPRANIDGRTVVIVDDGVATGATMKSSIKGVQSQNAARVIAALPVGPSETIEELGDMVDDVVCLSTPPYFAAVGQFYARFTQTTDEEVIEILNRFQTIQD